MDTQQQKQSKVLLIGETCIDVHVYGKVNRLCPEAPAPVFNKMSSKENLGMAGNVSSNLNALNVSHDFLTNSNFESVKKIRYVDERTNTLFIRVDENDEEISRIDISQVNFDYYDAVVIADYDKGFLTEEDIMEITDQHNRVFLDTKKSLGSWCQKAFIIKINNDEYLKSEDFITKKLSKKIIRTAGPLGCTFREETYPVESVEIKDVSGAGDTFLSGLVAAYVSLKNIKKSIRFANICSTYVVQRKGVTTVDASLLNKMGKTNV